MESTGRQIEQMQTEQLCETKYGSVDAPSSSSLGREKVQMPQWLFFCVVVLVLYGGTAFLRLTPLAFLVGGGAPTVAPLPMAAPASVSSELPHQAHEAPHLLLAQILTHMHHDPTIGKALALDPSSRHLIAELQVHGLMTGAAAHGPSTTEELVELVHRDPTKAAQILAREPMAARLVAELRHHGVGPTPESLLMDFLHRDPIAAARTLAKDPDATALIAELIRSFPHAVAFVIENDPSLAQVVGTELKDHRGMRTMMAEHRGPYR